MSSNPTKKLLNKLGSLKTVLIPNDTSTEEGRAAERSRKALLAGATSALVKVGSLLSLLIAIPLTLGYLGRDRYGLWIGITGFFSVMQTADLGLGLGLLSSVAQHSGDGNHQALITKISNTFFMLLALALGFFLLAVAAIHGLPLGTILNTNSVSNAELREVSYVACGFVLLTMPFTVVQRVQFGLQEGYKSNSWQFAAVLLSILAIILATHFHASLPMLVASVSAPTAAVTLCNFIHFFFFGRPDLRPKFGKVALDHIRPVLRTGFGFLLITSGYQIAFSFDNLILTNASGPGALADFNTCVRFFNLLPSVVAMATMPMWPAFGEAAARKDVEWISKRSTQLWKIAAKITGGIGLPMLLLSHWVVLLLSHRKIHAGPLLLAGCFVTSTSEVAKSVLGPQLNGLGLIRYQAKVLLAYALISAPIQWVAAHYWGATGFAWATGLTSIILVMIPLRNHLNAHILQINTATS